MLSVCEGSLFHPFTPSLFHSFTSSLLHPFTVSPLHSFTASLTFSPSPPINPALALDIHFEAFVAVTRKGKRATLRAMSTSAQIHATTSRPTSVPGLTLVELDSPQSLQLVGVSAAWRKLITQADMAAPHIQVAAIEGEHGTGKHSLARYLFSRSPLANNTFQRRDAREWLVTDADPATLAGFTADQPQIKRGIDFLIANQKPDGSWPMISRSTLGAERKPTKLLTPITCAAGSWATLSLVTLVPKPETDVAHK